MSNAPKWSPSLMPWLLAASLLLLGAGCDRLSRQTSQESAGADQGASPGAPQVASLAASPSPPAGAPDGAVLFKTHCQACHGEAGTGGMGPALAAAAQRGEGHVRTMIANGSPDRGMPPFAAALTPGEVDAIVQHVGAFK
ncbi:MAG: cytochrome c [Candidatus Sericytochromatia bacterium]|nr:cytochrome c [Candidatus Sericytochromatia bacterium]